MCDIQQGTGNSVRTIIRGRRFGRKIENEKRHLIVLKTRKKYSPNKK